MYVGQDCISRSFLTRKNLTNNADIKKERLFIHAKDVEANCTKALRLCLSSDSPYKSFYQNNGTYPSGQNWFDYATWIRKAMHQLITKSGGTKDFDVEDTANVCNDSEDEDVMDDVEDAKEEQTKTQKKKTLTKKATRKKKYSNSDDDDSDYESESERSSDEDITKKSNVRSPTKTTPTKTTNDDYGTNDPPKDVYFKGYFSFLLWGYIPPPGYEHYKSLSMTTVEKKGDNKRDKKTLGRASSRKSDTDNKLIDERFERRGTLRNDGVEKNITELMVKGRIEMQNQKTFAVKKEKLEFLLKYEVEAISDLRADFRMCSSEDESEKLDIKGRIKKHQKTRDELKEQWEKIINKEEKRREVIA